MLGALHLQINKLDIKKGIELEFDLKETNTSHTFSLNEHKKVHLLYF